MAAYGKSLVWLLGCSTLGYTLLIAATPSDDQLTAAKEAYPGVDKSPVESQKKAQQIVDVLRAATETNRPLHRLNKKEIEDLKPKSN